jgi:hypothetical protein
MIPIPSSMTWLMLVGTPLLILIMLLPALFELKKPKDEGPRMIMGSISEMQILVVSLPIANIEEDQKFDLSLLRLLAKIIEALPSLEF